MKEEDKAKAAYFLAESKARDLLVPKEIAETAGAVALGTVIAQETLNASKSR